MSRFLIPGNVAMQPVYSCQTVLIGKTCRKRRAFNEDQQQKKKPRRKKNREILHAAVRPLTPTSE